ncbi:hypothetical protein M0802_011812 [Mischocyttarus mexicanus]|nr:hypothetical protein M0802_011812 [Mischocyttarus mexicanus]
MECIISLEDLMGTLTYARVGWVEEGLGGGRVGRGEELREYPVNPYTHGRSVGGRNRMCMCECVRTTTKYTGCPGIHRRLTSGETTSTSSVLNGQSLRRFPDCPVGLSTLKQTP